MSSGNCFDVCESELEWTRTGSTRRADWTIRNTWSLDLFLWLYFLFTFLSLSFFSLPDVSYLHNISYFIYVCCPVSGFQITYSCISLSLSFVHSYFKSIASLCSSSYSGTRFRVVATAKNTNQEETRIVIVKASRPFVNWKKWVFFS